MAFTSIPGANTTLTSSTLSNLITELRPVYVRKTADETVNNSATLQADDALTLAVSASAEYKMDLRLIVNSGTTPDFKCQFTYPTSTTATLHYQAIETAPNAGLQGPYVETQVFAIGTTGSDQIILFSGVWVISSTAGNIALTWAQNTATASDTKIKAGSYFHLQRMS